MQAVGEQREMQLNAMAGTWRVSTGVQEATFAPQRGTKSLYAIWKRLPGEVVSVITESSLYQGAKGARIGVGPNERECARSSG